MTAELLNKGTLTAKESVVNLIEQMIEDGSLAPGDSLPSELSISEHLGVARGTVRSGLEVLEEKEVIVKRRKRRTVAEKKDIFEQGQLLANTVVLGGLSVDNLNQFIHSPLISGVEATVMLELEKLPYDILTIKMARSNHAAYLQNLIDAGIKGVLFSEFICKADCFPQLYELCVQHSIPAVMNYSSTSMDKLDQVSTDHEKASYELTRKLIDMGCRNIANFTYEFSERGYWVEERYRGYEKAMKEAGLHIYELPHRRSGDIDHRSYDESSFVNYSRLFAGYLIDVLGASAPEKVDAIMVNEDWDVPIMNAACEIHGLTPCKDIIITGYDNKFELGPFYKYNQKKPTFTVDKQNELIGRTMVDLLKKNLNADPSERKPEHRRVEAKIIAM